MRVLKKRREIETKRGKPSTPHPRQMMRPQGKKNRMEARKRKKQRAGPNPATPEELVASYDPHESYGVPILKPNSPPHPYI